MSKKTEKASSLPRIAIGGRFFKEQFFRAYAEHNVPIEQVERMWLQMLHEGTMKQDGYHETHTTYVIS
jgi:hypothetical protein